MLDLVSNGRVEFGSGESSSEAELAGFGIDPLVKRERGSRGSRSPCAAWSRSPFTGVDGEFVKMPPRNVVPKPVQKPHPPLWVACSRRDTILLAAEKGMGALTFAFIDPEEARSWVGEYERTLAESCVPVGWSVNPQVACVSPMMLHHDEDEAIRRGVEGANFFGYSLGHFYVFGEHRPGVTDVWSEYEQRRAAQGFDPEAVARAVKEERLGAKVAAGDTHRAARRHRHAGAGPRVPPPLRGGRRRPGDLRAAGRAQPARAHHGVDRAVRARGAARVRSSATRPRRSRRPSGMAPVIAAAMARKPDTPRDLGDYSFPAIPRQWADAAGSEEMRAWLEHFADDRAAGKRDTELGIAG